ncbi:D-2-hydroxyacid dehydrogenase [Helicobacter canis]|uniref:D-2-hydroxyacid dehydrogenase n=1 Tax=Helicobacter canis TaxID=29419 RepID=A0A5M9QP16_9HELI|nr:D-2-hydroxyacid dehydrogenase [Helicobacter canis]KAA8710443.1 D-2-hydroxyacid dehydrogenase [Helicobacter canis]
MNIVNLDVSTLGADADFSELESFGSYMSYPLTSYDETYERVKDADIILTNKVVLDKPLLSKLPNLKLIVVTATGTNIVDVEYAKERNIPVRNAAGYSTLSVAQHTLTFALNLLSQMPYYDGYVKQGQWAKSACFTHLAQGRRDIDGLAWGIIGLGAIGQRVAMLATSFGARVSYTSTSGKNTAQAYPHLALDDLLAQSDIISIHAPLNPATKGLIDTHKLAMLKKDCVLINVGRGGIVDEQAVAARLKSGAQLYYACDVLDTEPMRSDHPFLDSSIQDRLLLSPHIAYAYQNSLKTLVQMSIDNVKEFLKA